MSLIEVGFGWLLGLSSSLIFRWYDRIQKIDNLTDGLKAELQEILPLLAGNIFFYKDKLGEFDHNFLLWFKQVMSKCQEDVFIPVKQLADLYLSLSPKELSIIMQNQKKSFIELEEKKGASLKKFYLKFYESNISSISLLPSDFQGIIFKIHSKLELINQEIDRYLFYFDKTFEPKSADNNLDTLKDNMKNSYEAIIGLTYNATNEIIKLLSLFQDKPFGFFDKLNDIIKRIRIDFIL